MIRSSRVLSRRKKPLTVVPITSDIVDHEAVDTEGTPIIVYGNTRPLNDSETRFLPEGQRADSFRVFNCSRKLNTTDDKAGIKGDIVRAHLGFDWRVTGEKPWGDTNRHNWYMIQKIGPAA